MMQKVRKTTVFQAKYGGFMASSTLLDTILSFSVLSTAFRKQTFIEFAVPKQSTVQRTKVQNL